MYFILLSIFYFKSIVYFVTSKLVAHCAHTHILVYEAYILNSSTKCKHLALGSAAPHLNATLSRSHPVLAVFLSTRRSPEIDRGPRGCGGRVRGRAAAAGTGLLLRAMPVPDDGLRLLEARHRVVTA